MERTSASYVDGSSMMLHNFESGSGTCSEYVALVTRGQLNHAQHCAIPMIVCLKYTFKQTNLITTGTFTSSSQASIKLWNVPSSRPLASSSCRRSQAHWERLFTSVLLVMYTLDIVFHRDYRSSMRERIESESSEESLIGQVEILLIAIVVQYECACSCWGWREHLRNTATLPKSGAYQCSHRTSHLHRFDSSVHINWVILTYHLAQQRWILLLVSPGARCRQVLQALCYLLRRVRLNVHTCRARATGLTSISLTTKTQTHNIPLN